MHAVKHGDKYSFRMNAIHQRRSYSPSTLYSLSKLNSIRLSVLSISKDKNSYSYGVIFAGSSRMASIFCWNAFRSGVLSQLVQSPMLFQVLITRWREGSSMEHKASPEIWPCAWIALN